MNSSVSTHHIVDDGMCVDHATSGFDQEWCESIAYETFSSWNGVDNDLSKPPAVFSTLTLARLGCFTTTQWKAPCIVALWISRACAPQKEAWMHP